MAMVSQDVSDAELLALPRDGRKYERVDGAIQVSPAGYRHGRIGVRLSRRLDVFVSEHQLGYVFILGWAF